MKENIQKLYGAMSKISDIAQKLIEAIIFVLVLSCALDLLLQVLYRFVLIHFVSFTCTWTTEYAQDALIWITYFAVGLCYKENTMASVNVIYDKLNPKGKLILYLFTRVIVFCFLFVGFKYGWAAIQSVEKWKSTNLHLPGWCLYGAPFMGCIFMAYEALTDVVGVLCGKLIPFKGRAVEVQEETLTDKEMEIIKSMEQEITK